MSCFVPAAPSLPSASHCCLYFLTLLPSLLSHPTAPCFLLTLLEIRCRNPPAHIHQSSDPYRSPPLPLPVVALVALTDYLLKQRRGHHHSFLALGRRPQLFPRRLPAALPHPTSIHCFRRYSSASPLLLVASHPISRHVDAPPLFVTAAHFLPCIFLYYHRQIGYPHAGNLVAAKSYYIYIANSCP
ncbi:hypothetical protein BHE74_00018108 [Ensete ventricosum]|nr:hypothetical protein BHE74_00018108 [Ensete ventricosum]RZR94461.1 hypothetical protein BHM03_00023147 [Ensete ventricosum]